MEFWPQSKPRLLSVCYGESGDISRPNDDAVIGQCDLIVERERAYGLVYGPQSKPRFICLLWGEAEVRVALNDRAERYRSCNLVTERAATGELALLGGECA